MFTFSGIFCNFTIPPCIFIRNQTVVIPSVTFVFNSPPAAASQKTSFHLSISYNIKLLRINQDLFVNFLTSPSKKARIFWCILTSAIIYHHSSFHLCTLYNLHILFCTHKKPPPMAEVLNNQKSLDVVTKRQNSMHAISRHISASSSLEMSHTKSAPDLLTVIIISSSLSTSL